VFTAFPHLPFTSKLSLHKRFSAEAHPQRREQIEREIDATHRQIDQLVYQLYGLTEEEIRIVEEATRDRLRPSLVQDVFVGCVKYESARTQRAQSNINRHPPFLTRRFSTASTAKRWDAVAVGVSPR